MTPPPSERSLAATYFDGRSPRARPARLTLRGRALRIDSEGEGIEVPLARMRWPERQRHGPRIVHLDDGGSLQVDDGAGWDAFARAAGHREGLVVRLQQNWRATLVAAVALLLLAGAGYRWGLPWLTSGLLALVPPSVDRSIGDAALAGVTGRWLLPSRRPAAEQQRLRTALAELLARARTQGETVPEVELHVYASRIGPNAFALPGGALVVTDELLELAAGRDDLVLGVLAHEVGHVRHRHGMRMLVQFGVLGAVTGIAIGDFSSVLATVPALLGQMAYSRDAEREADADSVRLLRAAGRSPAVMVEFFERVHAWRGSPAGQRAGADLDIGIAFSSHPADDERMRFFRDAALPR